MSVKIKEFYNALSENKIDAIYLFEGEDAFFRADAIARLKTKVVLDQDLNFVSFNGDVTANELLSSLESYSLFGDKRLIVVKEFYPDKKFLEKGLKSYFENPLSTSCLAIVNIKPCEALKKMPNVCVVDCNKGDEGTLTRWVKGECEKNGVSIDLETARTLVDFCLADMSKIFTEVQKLIAYAYENKIITVDTIKLLVPRDTEYKIYEMTDYIGKRQVNLALTVINEMLSKGETPQRIIVSVYNYFRRLLHVAISNKTALELSEIFGVKEYAVKKAKEQARMFSPRALKRAVDMLVEVDSKSKSGLMDMSEGMWLALFKIMVEK